MTKSGSNFSPTSRLKNLKPAIRPLTIAPLSMGLGGSCAPARLGAICPSGMVAGRRGLVDFTAGEKPDYGTSSLRLSNKKPRLKAHWIGKGVMSMARLEGPIPTRLEQPTVVPRQKLSVVVRVVSAPKFTCPPR